MGIWEGCFGRGERFLGCCYGGESRSGGEGGESGRVRSREGGGGESESAEPVGEVGNCEACFNVDFSCSCGGGHEREGVDRERGIYPTRSKP